jgi:hypothetical protein
MSDEIPRNPAPSDDDDAGQPIGGLGQLQHDTSPSFIAVVRGRIHRRLMVSELVGFSWDLPKVVFGEFVRMLIGILKPLSARKGE